MMQMVNGAVLERWSVLPDEQVVEQILAGQTALFEVLMRRHNERLYRAARAILRDEAEAEDVMQQAYVNAYAHLRQFDRRSSFATWLTRIAVNEAILRGKKRGRYQPLDEDSSTLNLVSTTQHMDNPEKAAYTSEMRNLLETAVDALPDGYREVFVMRDIEGLSTSEAAACLDISEDAAKTRLSRARAMLRQDLFDRIGATASTSFTFLRPRCDRIVAAVLRRIG
jgi:RNA polymerase sigma-70 factor (ECF subfamily)